MNKNKVTIFRHEDFGRVRTVMIDDEVWFVGKDVAEILGYAKPLNALAAHIDEDDSLKQGIIDSMGRTQKTILINESGLYSLIISSKLSNAKKFKRWITSEVLPSIRKTGQYSVNPEPPQNLDKLKLELKLAEYNAINLINGGNYPDLYKQTVTSYILNEMSGKYLLPLPEVETTYTATEIGNQLGISKQMVGRIANKHKLKNDKYGIQVMDLSTNGKQVPNFRYNEVGKNKIIEIIEKKH